MHFSVKEVLSTLPQSLQQPVVGNGLKIKELRQWTSIREHAIAAQSAWAWWRWWRAC
jgi:hypothetical protein